MFCKMFLRQQNEKSEGTFSPILQVQLLVLDDGAGMGGGVC